MTMYHGQEQREKHFDNGVVATRVPRRGPPFAKKLAAGVPKAGDHTLEAWSRAACSGLELET
jgi:hypothetical protein